jgi:hypothetical protein
MGVLYEEVDDNTQPGICVHRMTRDMVKVLKAAVNVYPKVI